MKRAFTRVEAMFVVGAVLILGFVLMPMFNRVHDGGDRPAPCQPQLKQIALAFAQYEQDYNEKFPPVAHKGSRGWSEDLQPYAKSWQIFQCRSTQNQTSETSDYFYNSRLSGRKLSEFSSTASTISIGDGQDDAPLDANLSSLPQTWLNDKSSPIYRHLNGANYGFADGHVRWLEPKSISNAPHANAAALTFAIR